MRMFGILDPALRKLGSAMGVSDHKHHLSHNPFADPNSVITTPWKPHIKMVRGRYDVVNERMGFRYSPIETTRMLDALSACYHANSAIRREKMAALIARNAKRYIPLILKRP